MLAYDVLVPLGGDAAAGSKTFVATPQQLYRVQLLPPPPALQQ